MIYDRMRKAALMMAIMVVGVMVSGCRKELCYDHPHNGSITINVNWRNLGSYPKPSGVRAIFIAQPDDAFSQTFNLPADGGSKNLNQGNYQLMLFNNDSELLYFRNMTKWNESEAFTAASRHMPYKSPPMNVPAGQPSVIGPRYGISEADLLMHSNEHQIYINEDPRKEYTIEVTPRCMVIPITVIVPVNSVKSVAEARGFLTGVSPSLFLGSGALSQSDSRLLFEYGAAAAGTQLKSQFLIFGMVDALSATDNKYTLGIEILLVDESVLYFEEDVTIKITDPLREYGGEIRLDNLIDIPDVDPPNPGGGGFKPGIDDWDDVTTEIPIG